MESEYRWDREAAFEKLKVELDDQNILPAYSWSTGAAEPEPTAPIDIEDPDDAKDQGTEAEDSEETAPHEPQLPISEPIRPRN